MNTQAMNIVIHAEYIAIFKNGRNAHRVSSILTQIYLLCDQNKLERAQGLLRDLYRAVYCDVEANPKVPFES